MHPPWGQGKDCSRPLRVGLRRDRDIAGHSGCPLLEDEARFERASGWTGLGDPLESAALVEREVGGQAHLEGDPPRHALAVVVRPSGAEAERP